MGREIITLAEQVRSLLGAHTAGLGQGGVTRPVSANNVGSDASSAREGEPNPASQARGVCARSRDGGHDFTVPKEKGSAKLFAAKVIMSIMPSNDPKGVERAKPLI